MKWKKITENEPTASIDSGEILVLGKYISHKDEGFCVSIAHVYHSNLKGKTEIDCNTASVKPIYWIEMPHLPEDLK